ncbi:MAG TPA: hypothetical protein VFM97_00365 [Gammaproteobacteria bacterium]|nr:hypothetical protein [Gammaproteobacteria bacterium]
MEHFFAYVGAVTAILLSLALFCCALNLLINAIFWSHYCCIRREIDGAHRAIGDEYDAISPIAARDVQFILKKIYSREWPDIGVIRERAEHDGLFAETFQARVAKWIFECFGSEISKDRLERNHRFLEESLELVQACGCSRNEALQMVDYVFGRPLGEKAQEVGGVMVTLAALCGAQQIDMMGAGDAELARIWMKIPQIRTKHQTKPLRSPLPGSLEPQE